MPYANSEGPDERVYACVVRKLHKGPFRPLCKNYVKVHEDIL